MKEVLIKTNGRSATISLDGVELSHVVSFCVKKDRDCLPVLELTALVIGEIKVVTD